MYIGGHGMKLLFDQNLSPRLPIRLADIYPNSMHVDAAGLGAVMDSVVWDYALENEFIVVTKDEDYSQMSVLKGSPPKVLWLVIGNCTTVEVEVLLRTHEMIIREFSVDDESGVLVLG